MANKVIISPLNGIRFVPTSFVTNDRWNSKKFDEHWYKELIEKWEARTTYSQKIQKKDPLAVQIMATVGSQVEIRGYKCDGTQILTPLPQYLTPVLNAPTINVNGTNMINYFKTNSNYFTLLPDYGIYYVVLRVQFPNGNIQEFISEPLDYQEKHEGTMLLSYKNSYNKDHILFEQSLQRFYLRLPAIQKIAPKQVKTVFVDQMENSKLLSATAFRNWDFTFGGNKHWLPDYIWDKLNHIFSLDDIVIDGKGYSVLEDSNIGVDSADNYTLKSFNITLGEKDNNLTYEFVNPTNNVNNEILYDPNTGFGVVLINGGITNNLGQVQWVFEPRVINGQIDLNQTATDWNIELANSTSFDSRFSIDETNSLIFEREDSDNINELKLEVLDKKIVFTANAAAPQQLNITFDLNVGGEGAIALISKGALQHSFNVKGEFNQSITLPLNGVANEKFYIYYNDNANFEHLGINNIKDGGGERGFGDKLNIESNVVSNIGIKKIEFNNNLDSKIFEFYENPIDSFSQNKLESVSAVNNNILGDNAIFEVNNYIDSLKYFDYKDNDITKTNATNIIDSIYNNAYEVECKTGKPLLGGVIDLRNQATPILEYDDIAIPAILDEVKYLGDRGWQILLGVADDIDFGIVNFKMFTIEKIVLCCDEYVVSKEFADRVELIDWLNNTFVVGESLLGVFYVNGDNVFYRNVEGFCNSYFVYKEQDYEIIPYCADANYEIENSENTLISVGSIPSGVVSKITALDTVIEIQVEGAVKQFVLVPYQKNETINVIF